MLLDFTLRNKGGHFDFYAQWCNTLDHDTIHSRKNAIFNFIKIIKSKKLIIPSANIFDRNFLFYFFVLIIRYVLGKNNNYMIVHTAKRNRLEFYYMIAPKNIATHFTFSNGLNQMLLSSGFSSHEIIFPNIKEFDIDEKPIDIPFKNYIIIWGRSAREIDNKKIQFLSQSSHNYIILNSNFTNITSDNIFLYKTNELNEQKFLIKQSMSSLIVVSKKSLDYFKYSNGASGILITNVYLNVFSFIIGEIPSHLNEFDDLCHFLPEDINVSKMDLILSKKVSPKLNSFKYRLFEEF